MEKRLKAILGVVAAGTAILGALSVILYRKL